MNYIVSAQNRHSRPQNPRFMQILGAFLLLSGLLISAAQATVAVKVFSRDEGMSESNMSKPRIYIQNTGAETINNFTYRYFFTTENSLPPMLEPYYLTDKEQVMLVPYGSGYYIQYTVTAANLTPGGLMPDGSGNVVGLHYSNWSAWTKTNDFSNNLSSSFAENQNISVYVAGTLIYGNEPSGGGGSGSGSVLREVWTGISGASTDLIPITTTPNVSGQISSLDEPRQYADNFGSRIRGYIIAPTSGSYTFWIASDDDSKFFLSTDADPANKGTAIASVTNGYTDYLQWNKYTSQKSAVKTLVAGSKYYIEVLHKDGTQYDNCSVGWLKPGQSGTVPSEIVPSSVLTPYVPTVVPAAPTSFTATAFSSQRIDLSWTDASNNEFGFRIEKKSGSGGYSEFVMVAANQTSYQVTGLSPETNYMFKIRAYNTYGNSDYAGVAQATTFAMPVGSATRELWTGMSGSEVSAIPVNTTPNDISPIYQLETPQQVGDYFGRRIRGYIIPPATGSYTFWIASDDCSQLWLSTNDQATSKVLIASVSGSTGYTAYHEWNKYSSQKSAVKTLTAGARYYVEILHKEGNQYDNLSVGWIKPGQSGSVPSEIVPGSVLSPFIIPCIPAAPSVPTATPVSATQIDLTWSDNSNNENGFRIERALGAGSFVEIGIAAANSGIYHDAGLTALTQYRYRIRSYNDLGNSGYSAIANAITLQQTPSVPPSVDLCSFAVYSTNKTTLKDRCVFSGGGAVGSNTAVEMFPQSVVTGNVVSGGNITLKSQAVVNGNVTAAGTVTLESGAVVNNGTIQQGATIATIDIPSITTIPTGTEPKTVYSGQNLPLAPGYYGAMTVNTGGTLTLSAGLYTFTSFFLQPEAHVVLNVAAFSDMIDIQVSGDLEFSDRSTVLFGGATGYVPFIRFYTNDNNTVRIGCDVQMTGILSAPNGNIAMYSRAQCNGALYGKTITIEPDAVIMSNMSNPNADSDGDHVANILEVIMGTDPNNPASFIPIAVPSIAMIDNTHDVTITYDYSIFYPDYAFADSMTATFPANSLTRSYIPLLPQVKNVPTSVQAFTDTSQGRSGRYIEFTDDNSLLPGKDFTIKLPRVATLSSNAYEPYQYDGSVWMPLSASDVICSYDDGVEVSLPTTNPTGMVAPKKKSSTTLYFDDACYSTSPLSMFTCGVAVPIGSSGVKNLVIRVDYLDYSTNPAGVAKIYEGTCSKINPISQIYVLALAGQFSCAGPMKITTITHTFTNADNSTYSHEYNCGNNFIVTVGQSLTMTSAGSPDDYKNSSDDHISLAYNQNAEIFESLNFGEGRIVTNATSNNVYEYYLKDHLGSTRMVINNLGNVVEATTYQPYGAMSQVGGATSAISVRKKFTTKEFDQEGGTGSGSDGMKLFYFGARYYDPEVGVWTSTDPENQYWNAYSFCGYDPINTIDPTGLAGWEMAVDLGKDIATASRLLTPAAALAAAWISVNAGWSVYQTFIHPYVNSQSSEMPWELQSQENYDMWKETMDKYGPMQMSSAEAGQAAQSGSMGAESTPGDPNQFDPNRLKFKPSQKHHMNVKNDIGKPPSNPQPTLRNSIQVKSNSPMRIGIDKANKEIVIFRQTQGEVFHGYTARWSNLTQEMKNTLIKNGLATIRGVIW